MDKFRFRLQGIEIIMPDGSRMRYKMDGMTDNIERDRVTYTKLYGARKVLFTYLTIG